MGGEGNKLRPASGDNWKSYHTYRLRSRSRVSAEFFGCSNFSVVLSVNTGHRGVRAGSSAEQISAGMENPSTWGKNCQHGEP